MASLPHKIWLQHLPTTTLHLLRLPLPYRILSNWFHEGADGFTQKISKNDLVNEEIRCADGNLGLNCFVSFSAFLSSLFLVFCPLLHSSNSLSLFHSKVCKVYRGLQHWRREERLQEGVHRPPSPEARHPPAVGGVWGAAEWVLGWMEGGRFFGVTFKEN